MIARRPWCCHAPLAITALIIGLTLCSRGAKSENAYLCISASAVGFSFDNAAHQWHPSTFSVVGKKYLLRKQAVGWSWNAFGESGQGEKCDDMNAAGYIFCHGLMDTRFDEKTLRFQVIQPFGYVGGLWRALPNGASAEGTDTPYIEIGTCSPL